MKRRLAWAAFFLFPLTLRADISPGPMLGGGIPTAGEGGGMKVRMASERVELTLSPDRIVVDARFRMENPGPAAQIQVGFS